MSLFEYLMVLVSIIVGLGVAEVLTGIAQQIRYRQSGQWYWLHTCGVALCTLALLQSWWEFWRLNSIVEWNFSSLILMIISPAALYLIAHLAFPERGKGADMRVYYYNNARLIWSLAILSTIASMLFPAIAFGSPFWHLDNAAPMVLATGFVFLAIYRNALLHSIVVPIFLMLLLSDVLIWHPSNSAAG